MAAVSALVASDRDWTQLTPTDRLALYNLLQTPSLLPDELRVATLVRALGASDVAWRLAGVVGAQGSAPNEDIKAALVRLCQAETNDTVCGRAGTSVRDLLSWPDDAAAACAVLDARNGAFDDVMGFVLDHATTEAEVEGLPLSDAVKEQAVAQFRFVAGKRARGEFVGFGGCLAFVPNLSELELQDSFPDVPMTLLCQCRIVFEDVARGADSATTEQVLAFSASKGHGHTEEDIDRIFGEEPITLVPFVRGLMHLIHGRP